MYNSNEKDNQLPKVGIAIPAYNVEKYIEECIESVLRQSYKNIVIAIVNDGSTDHTWSKIQRYLSAGFPIIGINAENKGVMQSRLAAVEQLNGCDYILFVDADDFFMDSTIIEKCVINMKDADMVCFNAAKNGEKACFKQTDIMYIDCREGIRNILCHEYLDGNMWAACYRYEYVKKSFKVLKCNNDEFINKAAFINACSRITVLPDIGYYYRVNNESLTHQRVRESDYMFYDHVCEFCKKVRHQYPEFIEETEYFEEWALLWIAAGLNKDRGLKQLSIYRPVMKELSKRSGYLTNKYFSAKDRLTYLCIRMKLYHILYKLYHKIWKDRGAQKHE